MLLASWAPASARAAACDTFTGANSNDWSDGGNWSFGHPPYSDDACIPAGKTAIMNGSGGRVGVLTVSTGATVQLKTLDASHSANLSASAANVSGTISLSTVGVHGAACALLISNLVIATGGTVTSSGVDGFDGNQIQGNITNHGTLASSSGVFDLRLTGTSHSDGTVRTDSGGTFALDTGTFSIDGGTVSNDGQFHVGYATLAASAGAVSGAHPVTLDDNASLAASGTGTGTFTTAPNAHANLTDDLGAGYTINVVCAGSSCDAGHSVANLEVRGNLTSRGTINVDGQNGGFTRLYIDQTLTNAGTINLNTLVGPGISGGTLTNAGTLKLAAGSDTEGAFAQTAGLTVLGAGASLAAQYGGTVGLQGGTLIAAGSDHLGKINNAGQLILGASGGVTRVEDGFTQTSSGSFSPIIAGAVRGTGYAALDVNGPVALAGTLTARAGGGFVPTQGESFDVINGNSRAGTFGAVTSDRVGNFEYHISTILAYNETEGYRDQGVTVYAQDVVPPRTFITGGPRDGSYTQDHSPIFTFTADKPGASYECSVDGADFDSCSGPGARHTASGLSDGVHVFAVLSVDSAGNADRSFPYVIFNVGRPPSGAGGRGGNGSSFTSIPFRFSLRGLKVQKLRRVLVRATCSSRCTLVLSASLLQRRAGRVRARTTTLGLSRQTFTRGGTRQVAVPVARRLRQQLRGALRSRRASFLVLSVRAYNANGLLARLTTVTRRISK